MDEGLRLIAGLGNPGIRYKNTRHNIGYTVVNEVARIVKSRFKKDIQIKSYIARKENLVLAKPYAFMNLSGVPVRKALQKFDLDFENMLIICDDLDLPLGKIRIKPKGGTGGHKGLDSVSEVLQTKNFSRLRIGIGRPLNDIQVPDFVLSRFSRQETQVIQKTISVAAECIFNWVTEDIEQVMAKFN